MFSIEFSSFFKVFTLLLIVSSQLFNKVQGGGSQDCSSFESSHSTKCGPLGIQSPPKALEENSIIGTESSWWNAINMFFEVMYDAFDKYAAEPGSYLQSALLKQLSRLILPILYGLLMVLYSWLLVYYDSSIPGVFPPTPISPKKHRIQSGHTFHLGYLLGLINGIIVFGLTYWEEIMN